eukprot:g1099.t1
MFFENLETMQTFFKNCRSTVANIKETRLPNGDMYQGEMVNYLQDTKDGNVGASVLLVEPLTMIGGMGAAGGVGLMNQGCGDNRHGDGARGCTGLCREWGLRSGKLLGFANDTVTLFPPPAVMARAWTDMLESRGLYQHLRLGCRVTAVATAAEDAACVSGATVLCGEGGGATASFFVAAKVFIDASYDGDIMVAAGVTHTSGREASSQYNESLAGFMPAPLRVSAVGATFPNGSVLEGVSPRPPLPAGAADDRLMSYQYFACVTQNASTRRPFEAPAGYDPADFLLLQREIDWLLTTKDHPKGPDLRYFSEYQYYSANKGGKLLPGDKVLLCCGMGLLNCDEPELNRGYASANYSERLRIQAKHRYYLLGSLYYMATDPKVPPYTREHFGSWGLCGDQYEAFDNFPPQIYNRISNRMVGDYVTTQNNIANPRRKPDGISMMAWTFDQHFMSRVAVPSPALAGLAGLEGLVGLAGLEGLAEPEGGKQTLVAANEGLLRHEVVPPHRPCWDPEAQCGDGENGGGDGNGSGTPDAIQGDDNQPPVPGQPSDMCQRNWYDVPFRVMLPRQTEARNLLVPVAHSSSSLAYSSLRIEGGFCDMGTAAGVAAGLAIKEGRRTRKRERVSGSDGDDEGMAGCSLIHATNVTEVQRILTSQYKQRVHGPPDWGQ